MSQISPPVPHPLRCPIKGDLATYTNIRTPRSNVLLTIFSGGEHPLAVGRGCDDMVQCRGGG